MCLLLSYCYLVFFNYSLNFLYFNLFMKKIADHIPLTFGGFII